MSESIITIKNIPITRKDLDLVVVKTSNESFKLQSQMGQFVLVQKTIYEEAIEIMLENIEDMGKKIDHKDNTRFFETTQTSFLNREIGKEWKKQPLLSFVKKKTE